MTTLQQRAKQFIVQLRDPNRVEDCRNLFCRQVFLVTHVHPGFWQIVLDKLSESQLSGLKKSFQSTLPKQKDQQSQRQMQDCKKLVISQEKQQMPANQNQKKGSVNQGWSKFLIILLLELVIRFVNPHYKPKNTNQRRDHNFGQLLWTYLCLTIIGTITQIIIRLVNRGKPDITGFIQILWNVVQYSFILHLIRWGVYFSQPFLKYLFQRLIEKGCNITQGSCMGFCGQEWIGVDFDGARLRRENAQKEEQEKKQMSPPKRKK